jgi:hypothetical protein
MALEAAGCGSRRCRRRTAADDFLDPAAQLGRSPLAEPLGRALVLDWGRRLWGGIGPVTSGSWLTRSLAHDLEIDYAQMSDLELIDLESLDSCSPDRESTDRHGAERGRTYGQGADRRRPAEPWPACVDGGNAHRQHVQPARPTFGCTRQQHRSPLFAATVSALPLGGG